LSEGKTEEPFYGARTSSKKQGGGMTEASDAETDKVCLLDDDLSVLRSMHYLLASDGLKVRPFNKPEDFLAHASIHHVPVLVTDIWMDRVRGLEVLARLCAISPKTRVIVITAREDLAARATVMAIGPVAFFMKPFNDEKFLTTVRDTLTQARDS
jgi:two-component system response regulator FixJ